MSATVIPTRLSALAEACGIEHSYVDQAGDPRQAPESTVRAILSSMGLQAHDEDAAEGALAELESGRWRHLVSPSIVVVSGEPASLPLHVPADSLIEAELELEGSGDLRQLHIRLDQSQRRLIDGEYLIRGAAELPDDLPEGYHVLTARVLDGSWSREDRGRVIVAPRRCPLGRDGGALARTWGWMIQLYSTRSRSSWGIGDLADLGELSRWSGERGAGFVLCNPLHAVAPTLPQEPSPYYPSSRRFANPLYLAIEQLPECSLLESAQREQIARLAAEAQQRNRDDRIDRDGAFTAKQEALTLLHAVRAPRARRAAFARYCKVEGAGLEDFATYCALAEFHGPDWREWPFELRHPRLPAVSAARAELAGRIDYHAWLQWLCDEQLAAAQQAAIHTGMGIGVIHDLAVGVNPGGSDAWALQDHLAAGVTIGAPPDIYNQRGQNWALPPLLPAQLSDTGYTPLRDMLRSVLRHAGGVRIDHILGFFRLFWIPEGAEPADGAFVRYPADALLGVLALEAVRAGAAVVGEDLGTVPPGVRETLRARGVMGSRVLYFERTPDDAHPLPAADYAELALTTVTTHDLPTAAGWWTDEEVKVKSDLGLLRAGATADGERAQKAAARAELLQLLRDEGLVGEHPEVEELVVAMHAFLARTPSLLVAGALWDGLADRRQPNMPATVDEYPNWRLPLAESDDGEHRAVLLEEAMAHPLVLRVAQALAARGGGLEQASLTQPSCG